MTGLYGDGTYGDGTYADLTGVSVDVPTYPVIGVQFMFGRGPYDGATGSSALTSLSARVKSITTTSGRTNELDATPAGTATVTLDNFDRLYDPFNTASPEYANLLPGRQVRIQATWDGVIYPVWQGFTEEWPQTYGPPESADVEVPCVDALGQTATAALPTSVYAATVIDDAPVAWYRLNETSGITMQDSSGNYQHGQYHGNSTQFTTAGLLPADPDTAIAFDAMDTYGAAVYAGLGDRHSVFGLPRALEFWWRGVIASTVSEFRLVGVGHGHVGDTYDVRFDTRFGLRIRFPGQTSDYAANWFPDGRSHHFVLYYFDGNTPHLYIDGVEETIVPIFAAPRVAAVYGIRISDVITGQRNGTTALVIDDVAIYNRSSLGTTASMAAAHNAAGRVPWNGDNARQRITNVAQTVQLSELAPVSTAMSTTHHVSKFGPAAFTGANDPLDYLQRVERTEQGRLITRMSLATGPTVDLLERDPGEGSATVAAVFTDDPAGTYHYNADIVFDTGVSKIRNVITVTYPLGNDASGGSVTLRNAASVTAYGQRPMQVDSMANGPDEARHIAEYMLLRYRKRERVTQLSITPSGDNSLWPVALGLKIGDRVQVRRKPQDSGTAFTLDCKIDGVDHQIQNGVNEWTTTFRLSVLDPASPGWFTWGTTAWGAADHRWYL